MMMLVSLGVLSEFLSTPSARRATAPKRSLSADDLFLSTPSARRATRRAAPFLLSRRDFYPRPPRGGRPCPEAVAAYEKEFLSTPSARRATTDGEHCAPSSKISIHALREEGDQACSARSSAGYHFYPRPPRGGRQHRADSIKELNEFLSTPSARRATPTPTP